MNLRTATGYVHISPSPAYYAQHQLQAPTDNSSYMTYCGGPVMLTNTTYAIYWAPSGHPITATYQTIINRYFNDVGGSPLYGILLQYYQEPPRTFIQSQSNFGGAYVYTATYPHAGTIANPLTDADIQNAVTATIQAKGWRTGLSAVYFVFTAEGIDSCESPGSCADNIFCGYHGDFTFAGQHVIYANMPFGSSWGCDPGGPYPNDIAADTELDTASHEHFEAVTDPLFASNSWLDPSGDEIGDKCVFFYGARASDGHNVMLNQHPYLMQTEWSNREADGVTPNLGCSKGYVHFLPVLLFGN